MDFNTVYAQKLTTADRVAALVKDDDWVDYGWAIGTPVSFDAALAKRLPELHGIKFRGGILCHVPEIFKIENQAEHFCWNSWHMGGIERKAVAAGYAYYSPLRYSELPRYYRESPDPLNIAVFVVAPMDNHGYFNLGPCASHLADAARKADKVFVEVNKNMPVCLGGYDNCLHISQVDGIIEVTTRRSTSLAAAVPPPKLTRLLPAWWWTASPTVPACSLASAACPTPSAP